MSGGLTKPRRAPAASLSIPRVADPVTSVGVNTAFGVIEQYELGRTARDSQSIPTHAAIRLTSPDGTTWQITMQDGGTFSIEAVPR